MGRGNHRHFVLHEKDHNYPAYSGGLDADGGHHSFSWENYPGAPSRAAGAACNKCQRTTLKAIEKLCFARRRLAPKSIAWTSKIHGTIGLAGGSSQITV